MRRLTLIALNEFNDAFLRQAADRHGLANIARVTALDRSRTLSEDRIEHQGLDPWVQWVSVHTGQPLSRHGIRRMGEVEGLQCPQLWERLSGHGISSGVWGAMNARRGEAEQCRFFFPDPWTFTEAPYPDDLRGLMHLPRYMAKNYLAPSWPRLLAEGARTAGYFLAPGHWATTGPLARTAARLTAAHGLDTHVFTLLFEYAGTLEFLRLKRQCQPQFSLIFINSLAHAQHHFWRPGDDLHRTMRETLVLIDSMLGLVLDSLGQDEALVVASGLSQDNVAGQGKYVYRQVDPAGFARVLGLDPLRVEQGMTNDGFLIFADAADAAAAAEVLRSVRLDGDALLDVELKQGASGVFYQIPLERRVPADAVITVGERSLRFGDLIEPVRERSGAHSPHGTAYARGLALPPELPNHALHDEMLRYFGVPRAA